MLKRFHCRQCGSCCELIPSLLEVSKQGDMRRLYQYVQEHLKGFLWEKISVQTFSEFLYYVRDFSSAEEQLGKKNPVCPFLMRNGSVSRCIVHKAKPTGCKRFPKSQKEAYQLTLDCRGWHSRFLNSELYLIIANCRYLLEKQGIKNKRTMFIMKRAVGWMNLFRRLSGHSKSRIY